MISSPNKERIDFWDICVMAKILFSAMKFNRVSFGIHKSFSLKNSTHVVHTYRDIIHVIIHVCMYIHYHSKVTSGVDAVLDVSCQMGTF